MLYAGSSKKYKARVGEQYPHLCITCLRQISFRAHPAKGTKLPGRQHRSGHEISCLWSAATGGAAVKRSHQIMPAVVAVTEQASASARATAAALGHPARPLLRLKSAATARGGAAEWSPPIERDKLVAPKYKVHSVESPALLIRSTSHGLDGMRMFSSLSRLSCRSISGCSKAG